MFASKVGSALVEQFKGQVQQKVERGEATKDSTISKTLEGLSLASVHDAPAILSQMLEWRINALQISASGRAGSNHMVLLRSKLIIEMFFLEAAKNIVADNGVVIPANISGELEDLAFDWILNGDRYVTTLRQQDQALSQMKDKVVLSASQLLGELSFTALESILERFLNEFGHRLNTEASSPSRQELYDLCHALRFLKLNDATSSGLISSIRFLEAVFPLRHVASEKKSRPQHALCDLLTYILSPLSDTNDPGSFGMACNASLRSQWFSTIKLLRTELSKWVARQTKQAMAGYPVLTALICVDDENSLVNSIDFLIESLNKQLKDKKLCSMSLLCITRCVSCFLRRLSGRSDPERLAKWVARSTQLAISLAIKGSLISPDQIIVMKHLCVSIAGALPEYAIQGVILEMMKIETGHCWEAPYIAVSSIVPILSKAPGRLFDDHRDHLETLPPTPAALEALMFSLASNHPYGKPISEVSMKRMEHLMQQGYSLLDVLDIGHLSEELSGAIDKIRAQCHQLHGFSKIPNSARYQGDRLGKERISALTVLVSILDGLPFIVPKSWKSDTKATRQFMEDIPGYTIHAEPCVRKAAMSALVRCMKAWVGSRDFVIQGMIQVIKSILFDYVDLVEELSSLMLRLINIWEASLSHRNSDSQTAITAPSDFLSFPFHNIESCGLYLISHESEGVRKVGLKILQAASRLQSSMKHRIGSQRGLDSDNSKLSSIGSRNSERIDFETHYEHSRVLSQPFGASFLEQGHVQKEPTLDKLRKSFTDGMIPASNSLPSLWQNTISSTAFAEPTTSAPSSPTAAQNIEQRSVIAIINEFGDQISRNCYWNYGIYSNILQAWKPVPDCCSFENCISEINDVDAKRRWFKIISELMRYCWIYARETSVCIVSQAFETLFQLMAQDQLGRQHLPQGGTKGFWGNMLSFIVAPTPISVSLPQGESIESKMSFFVSLMINSTRMGSEVALDTFACLDGSFQSLVVQQSQCLESDYLPSGMDKKSALSKSIKGVVKDSRLMHAQILTAVCSQFAPSTLSGNVAMKEALVSFVVDTIRYIDILSDISSEIQQLRYCVCTICRQLALQLSVKQPQDFPPMLRKQLYGKFGMYTEEGQTQGLFRSELRRQIAAAKAAVRPRDPERAHQIEKEILVSSEMLEHAANLAMAAMLAGPIFDSETSNPNGRVLTWIQRMLESPEDAKESRVYHFEWAPKKQEIAKEALYLLLSSNLDMGKLFVDQSYSAEREISKSYFLVLAEVITLNQALKLDPQILIALVLSKMVDPDPQSRSKARKMLHTIERRYKPESGIDSRLQKIWTEEEPPLEAEIDQDLVVVGGLQNSHILFQQKVSSAMAIHYEDISFQVVLEVLKRQARSATPDRIQQTLSCLPPWLENADFSQDLWRESVLDLLFRVSQVDTLIQTNIVQSVWGTIASHRRNIIPVLDYLLVKLLEESRVPDATRFQNSTMESAKHIALYLSRVSPKYTIEHLITLAESEILHLSNQDEPTDEVPTSNVVELGLIKEWHHRATYSPAQQRLPLQQPLAARAAAAIAAETSDLSKPFTASSFAQVIKRSTVDLILKTGVAVADTVVVAGAAAVGTISASGLGIIDDEDKFNRSRTKYGEYDPENLQEMSRMDFTENSQNEFKICRNTNSELPVPRIISKRIALNSQEASLCLISDIASENDEHLRPHLPELLHIAVLQLDSCNELACDEACQLLQFLLYNLSYKILETNSKENKKAVYSSEYARVAGAIGFLQQVPKGERIWDWELPTLSHPWVRSAGSLAAFVQIIANCFPFDSELCEKWSSEALKWACCSATRHGASRSHQIYCSLSPSLTSPACTALLFCLEKCLRNATSDGLDTGIEILCTLRVLLSNTRREKVILYPHLLAASIALLNSSVVRVGELALSMLIELLDCLDFADITVQQAILSVFAPEHIQDSRFDPSFPVNQKWILGNSLLGGLDFEDDIGGPWFALQQLLIKGLFQVDTESLSLIALGSVCRQISRATKISALGTVSQRVGKKRDFFTVNSKFNTFGGIESIIGDITIGLALTISSTLPWIFVQVNIGESSAQISGFLKDLSLACECIGWHDLGAMLLCLETDPNSKMDLDMSCRNWSKEVIPIVIQEIFPKFGLLFIQRIVETVQRATSVYQRAALYILEAIFNHPDLDVGNDQQILDDTCLIDVLAHELNGDLGTCVVRVMQALSRYQGSGRKDDTFDMCSWRDSIDEIGECNKICSAALKRVAFKCPGTAELLRLMPDEQQVSGKTSSYTHLLPFLPE